MISTKTLDNISRVIYVLIKFYIHILTEHSLAKYMVFFSEIEKNKNNDKL